MIWIIHFLIVTLLLLLAIYVERDFLFIFTSFVYTVFIFGQRWMTGTDFPYYFKYYLIRFQVREPLYRMFQNFLSDNQLYFGILIFLCFLISTFNNYRFIIKINKNTLLMLYLYLISEIFFAQQSQIRQFVAISFFINAYFYAFEKKHGKSIINVLLGMGFHTSIIFLIPFLFVNIKVNKIKAMYVTGVALVLPLFDITTLLKLPFFSRYSHYIDSVFDVNLSIYHILKYYTLLVIVFLFIWNLEQYKNETKDQMILNGLLIYILLYGLSFQFALMIRIGSYFKIFEIIFLMYFYREVSFISKSYSKLAILSLFALTYVGLMITDPYEISKYSFQSIRILEQRDTEELWEEFNSR